METIRLNHGSGGREMHNFISNTILKKLGNPVLEKFDDSAVMANLKNTRIAMTTDSYVVSPLFFKGGDIGRLSVCGTVNDLATSGAVPYALSLSFILEEGFPLAKIEKILDSIAVAAKEADVKIVTGDTKVVERGKGDGIYINTCGIGFIPENVNISTHNAAPGDIVMLTGPIGNHEITMLVERGGIDFETSIESDAAPLNKKVESLLKKTDGIRVIKDPTRGGLASALKEICDHSMVNIEIREEDIPVDPEVESVCEFIGYDPVYLANEGKYIIILKEGSENHVIDVFGNESAVIGRIGKMSEAGKPPELIMETESGGKRRLGMLETIQLPRIC